MRTFATPKKPPRASLAASAAAPSLAPAIHAVDSSSERPLEAVSRDLKETRSGHTFSHVRVQTKGRAGETGPPIGERPRSLLQRQVQPGADPAVKTGTPTSKSLI